jgi:hypothetical protein
MIYFAKMAISLNKSSVLHAPFLNSCQRNLKPAVSFSTFLATLMA